jgi:hypothetical protein
VIGVLVTQFSVATTEYAGNGKERPEYHNIVTWVWRPHGRTFTRPSGLCRPWNETPVALGLRTRILLSP